MNEGEYVGGEQIHYYHIPVIDILNKIELVGKRILEIGCAGGTIVKYLKERNADYIRIDLKKRNLENLKELNVKEMDARKLEFRDKAFDIIISCETFEHIDEVHLAIKEVHRVLKDDGKLIITVPNDIELELMWGYCNDRANLEIKNRGHINQFYDTQEVEKRFNNFKIIKHIKINPKIGFYENRFKNRYIKRIIRITSGKHFNIHNCFLMKKSVKE